MNTMNLIIVCSNVTEFGAEPEPQKKDVAVVNLLYNPFSIHDLSTENPWILRWLMALQEASKIIEPMHRNIDQTNERI